VSAPKNKKSARREPRDKRRKRTKHKLMRLDDLIPDQDVKGGHQLLFGLTETTQSKNNPK